MLFVYYVVFVCYLYATFTASGRVKWSETSTVRGHGVESCE